MTYDIINLIQTLRLGDIVQLPTGIEVTVTRIPAPQPVPAPPPVPVPPPAPVPTAWDAIKAQFDTRIVKFGRQLATNLSLLKDNPKLDLPLAETYYDTARVFFSIADYTKDASWETAAQDAIAIYRDRYVIPNNGKVPGYWVFPHGLMMDWFRNNHEISKQAVQLLSDNAAYGADITPDASLVHPTRSREVAYALMADLCMERMGGDYHSRTDRLQGLAIGHINQWISGAVPLCRPFMAGLTMEALIQAHTARPSDIIPGKIQALCDFLWLLWDPVAEAFPYGNIDTKSVSKGGTYPDNAPDANTGDTKPAPDLNLLICPAFAWVYSQTKDSKYLVQADAIFTGGVKHASLNDGKHFNQNHRWVFDYLKWRA